MLYLTALVISLVIATAAVAGPPRPGPGSTTLPPEPTPAAALSAPIYVLTGSGYGHGVGLSQWGAFAQAKANRDYHQILSFYYPGTTVAKAPISKVRVLIADARPAVTIGSALPFSVRDASGAETPLPAGNIILKPDLKLVVDGVSTTLPAPLAFVPGPGSPLTLDGKGYRGQLRATVTAKRLRIVDLVALDAYILGVLPGEMPNQWPAAALEAQAVAARSYALASIVKDQDFDLYADPRSQMYYGIAAESPATTAAVQGTRSEILTYDGKVATTFYSSSSGGQTAASEDVFGVKTPYLVSRPDPWDALSPYHRWVPRTFTAASLGIAFGLSAPVVDVEIVQTPSGRPASVTLIKKTGVRVLLKAADVRARLGLRSTAFRLGVLRVATPPFSETPGTPVAVTGVARDVDAPALEKLSASGSWVPAVRLKPVVDGSFAATVRPTATATYRLTAAGQAGPALTISVAAAGVPR